MKCFLFQKVHTYRHVIHYQFPTLYSIAEVPWKLPEEIGGDSVADAILGLQGYVLSGQDALLIAYCPEENA